MTTAELVVGDLRGGISRQQRSEGDNEKRGRGLAHGTKNERQVGETDTKDAHSSAD
jgi:hypothetical protein